MSSDDKQPFLARWSRRKLESSKETTAPKPAGPSPSGGVPAPGGPAGSSPATKLELPPLDSLRGLSSEYREFLNPGVDEKLRHAALNKLFRDPHFNVIDLMDVYIDDYTKFDPIPEAMLRTLTHAKDLLFGDEKVLDNADHPNPQGDRPDVAGTGREEQGAAPSQAHASASEPDAPSAPPDAAGPTKA